MSHSALEIDNWENIGSSFSYNHYSSYDGLNIDAAKLYYYLKEKFGKSTVSYSSFSKYFPERKFVLPNVWCYLFRYNSLTSKFLTQHKTIHMLQHEQV